jgi:hypothetical protein
MCVPIQCVHRDPSGRVTHVGGFTGDGRAWGLTLSEAIALVEAWQFSFLVEVPAGERVPVWVGTSSAGRKFLTTAPDGIAANNLDNLPSVMNPLSGVVPPYPLSIPGDVTCMLMTINAVSYAHNNALHPLLTTPIQNPPGSGLTANPRLTPPAAFWRDTEPHWIYIDATLPYPAYYDVDLMVTHGTTGAGRSMEWVSGGDIARRRTIEAAGHGWWTWDPVLTRPDGTMDPALPARLTPVRVIVRPGTDAWRGAWDINIGITASTANPYCRSGSGGAVGVVLARPVPAASPPPPVQVTVPHVVGLTEDVALRNLWALNLRVTVTAPVAMASDIEITSQHPTGGTVVNERSGVLLGGVVRQQSGGPDRPEALLLNNNSQRGNPLVIWLYDNGTGTWAERETIAFGAQASIDLDDMHQYQVVAVDATLNNCTAGQPNDVSCQYWRLQNAVVGGTDPAVELWIN